MKKKNSFFFLHYLIKGKVYVHVITVENHEAAKDYLHNKTCQCDATGCIFCKHKWNFHQRTHPKVGAKDWYKCSHKTCQVKALVSTTASSSSSISVSIEDHEHDDANEISPIIRGIDTASKNKIVEYAGNFLKKNTIK